MRKPAAIVGSALFFVVAPVVLGAVVPWLITRWEFRAAPLGSDLTRALGVLLILAGIPGLIDSFARFAVQGLGTPAPVAPTQHLVVTGLYRHVRNPMYVTVTSVILGQSLLFGDVRVAVYGALFWLTCHIFVVAYEEPTLARTFSSEYETFRAHVPRWIPRLRPWEGGR